MNEAEQLAQFQKARGASPVMRAATDFLCAPDIHAVRIPIMRDIIDLAVQQLVDLRQHMQQDGEERLTSSIIMFLCGMGIQAQHDPQLGGHIDILVTTRERFRWVCEAKLYRGPAYLLGGFDQLICRYTDANPYASEGCLLVYFFQNNAKKKMDEWRDALKEARPEDKHEPCDKYPLAFFTTLDHPVSGLPYVVRHVFVPLKFPADRPDADDD